MDQKLFSLPNISILKIWYKEKPFVGDLLSKMFYCFQIAQWGDGSDVVTATHPNQNQFKSDSPTPHPHWLPSNTLSTVSPAVQPLQLGHRHHVLREPAVLAIISPTPSSPSYLHLYSGVHFAPGPAMPQFFSICFFSKWIINLPGGQINVVQYCSLFLAANPFSKSWTPQGIFRLTQSCWIKLTLSRALNLATCFRNYRDTRILSGSN